jgi:hypothetical protein
VTPAAVPQPDAPAPATQPDAPPPVPQSDVPAPTTQSDAPAVVVADAAASALPSLTPPILDDPFLRAAQEQALGPVAPTPAGGLGLELRQAEDAEETPVELSRSESFEVRRAPVRTIAVVAALVFALALAIVLAIRR